MATVIVIISSNMSFDFDLIISVFLATYGKILWNGTLNVFFFLFMLHKL